MAKAADTIITMIPMPNFDTFLSSNTPILPAAFDGEGEGGEEEGDDGLGPPVSSGLLLVRVAVAFQSPTHICMYATSSLKIHLPKSPLDWPIARQKRPQPLAKESTLDSLQQLFILLRVSALILSGELNIAAQPMSWDGKREFSAASLHTLS